MKKINWLIAISLLLLVAAAIACQPAGPQEVEIIPATIEDVRVHIGDPPSPQVMVAIKGPFPYTCSSIHELKTQRSDSTINITLTIKSTPAAGCGKAEGYSFAQNVDLGSDFVSGETYIVNVNGETTSFVMK